MITLPVILFWAIAGLGLMGRPNVLIYLLFASMSFGAFAAIPPALLGDLTLVPATVCAMLIVARTFLSTPGMTFFLNSLGGKRLGLLFAFWFVAVLVTMFMPRLFAGFVTIMPIRATNLIESPLYPSMQNISQLAYLTVSVFLVFALTRILRTFEMQQVALKALCFGGLIAVVTGTLDYASQYIPISTFLDQFRTATYELHVEAEVMNAKRVVGLMPEASAFGAHCVGMLTAIYFFRRSIADDALRNTYAPILIGLLAGFAWLSTSSAAYVGLGLFGLFAGIEWVWRATTVPAGSRRREGMALEAWALFWGATALMIMMMMRPDILDPVYEMLDEMVFQKASTSSFDERNNWTAVSWQALMDTYGLGVGIGSTRPSNAFVAVMSNAGFVGGALFYAFVLQSLTRKALPGDSYGEAMLTGVRWAFLPGFGISLLIGTSADFGVFNAFLFGLATAIGTRLSVFEHRELLQAEMLMAEQAGHNAADLPAPSR
ncbi:MAG: hypothetical protein QNI84_00990 [Henriciella sp.]|nr:hypothetical protein [Henriciella sp.]